jgi:hypothetical protein
VNLFPTNVADAFHAAFDPPAVYNPNYGLYLVPCKATPPCLGVRISGTTFWTNKLDLTQLFSDDGLGNQLCFTKILRAADFLPDGIFILADPFLTNVVAVFDIGAAEMRFADRKDSGNSQCQGKF